MGFVKRLLTYITVKLKMLIGHEVVRTDRKEVFFTFDDGPDDGITQFVLELLEKYNASATFFCCGKQIEKYPQLYELIKTKGHTIGNHTKSHLKGEDTPSMQYIDDVNDFKNKYNTSLFRPPMMSLSLMELLKLASSNKIILWDVDSTDWDISLGDSYNIDNLVKKTRPGSIVLFHFVNDFAERTKIILPEYIEKLYRQGYSFSKINE